MHKAGTRLFYNLTDKIKHFPNIKIRWIQFFGKEFEQALDFYVMNHEFEVNL